MSKKETELLNKRVLTSGLIQNNILYKELLMFINLSEINNGLTICYSLKLELVDFYSKSTIDNAKVNLEHSICSCIDTSIEKV